MKIYYIYCSLTSILGYDLHEIINMFHKTGKREDTGRFVHDIGFMHDIGFVLNIGFVLDIGFL